MSTEPQRTCPSCGNELPGAMEFCPVCMLRKALADGFESGESSASEDTIKPTAGQAVQRFEHYELVTGEDGKPVELGRGAMGVTYKAFDVDLHCPVTLKVINGRYLSDESARLRFLREARAAASVRHPNVASVFHLGRSGENYFYAMEFVEGETLEDLIKRSGRLEVKLALEIAIQVAAGLAAIQKQKLVHRDIKPSNIMATLEDGGAVTAKIIDLGLAKAVSEPLSEAAISMLGAFAGTPEFASPEQFAGVQVDVRSDLYSLGVTLWKMLTGQTPFRGSSVEVMYQHQHAPLPVEQLDGIPQPLVVLLEVLLAKDPVRRFQNPTELLKVMLTVRDAIDAGRPMMKTIRVFVSSTGDVQKERHVADRVMRSIAAEFNLPVSASCSIFQRLVEANGGTETGAPKTEPDNDSRLVLCPLFLEYQRLQLDAGYQGPIPNTAEFDLVICILWSHLGTLLAPTLKMPDGSAPGSGTEYEIGWALDQAGKNRGVPGLRVYRNCSKPTPPLEPKEAREAFGRQWDSIQEFFAHWERKREGNFVGTFNNYCNLQEFEELFREQFRDSLGTLVDQETGQKLLSRKVRRWKSSPFRGLNVFDFEHAPIFHGRTRAIGEVLEALESQVRAQRPFVLVVGASGSGKSSLVRAGVLPLLTQPETIEGVGLWRWAITRPGAGGSGGDCFDALAAALLEPSALPALQDPESRNAIGDLGSELREHADSVALRVRDALDHAARERKIQHCHRLEEKERQLRGSGRSDDADAARQQRERFELPKARLALVVDQLEELFTTGFSPELRQKYISAIAGLVRSGRVFVLATLRNDFYASYQEFPDLIDLSKPSGKFDLWPPTPSEIGNMIRLPAEAAGLQFEQDRETGQGLDQALRDTASGKPESLPLLEHVLSLLNDQQNTRGDDLLRWSDYRELGELKGALAKHAEAVFSTLRSEEQKAFPLVMRYLVTLGQGEEEVPNRRTVSYRDFVASEGTDQDQKAGAKGFVDLFIEKRLLVADTDTQGEVTVCVAHEALLREWQRVKDWLKKNREFLRMRDRLDSSLKLWLSRGKQRDDLLGPGLPLAEGEKLVKDFGPSLSREQTGYVYASVNERKRRKQAQERIRYAVMAAISVLALVAGFQWLQAEHQRQTAEQNAARAQRNEARSKELLREASKVDFVTASQQRDPAARLAYLARAVRNDPSNQVASITLEQFITRQSAFPKAPLWSFWHDASLLTASFSPDGKWVVTASEDHTAKVWEAATGKAVGQPLRHDGRVNSAVFSPDGKWVVTASEDSTARLWEVHTGKLLTIFQGHSSAVTGAVFSPDGKLVLSASRDATARLWEAATGKAVGEPLQHDGMVYNAEFSPDGKWMVTACSDGTARLWETATGKPVGQPLQHDRDVWHADFSPDGKWVVTASGDRTARVWEAETGKPVGQPLRHEGNVTRAAFSPDGMRVVTASADGTARVWEAATGKPVGQPLRHEGAVASAAFSPDGIWVVTASDDHTARVWEAATGKPVGQPLRNQGAVSSAAFSPDGLWMVTASDDHTARVWEAANGKAVTEPLRHDGSVARVSVSPDGRWVVTVSADHTARVWEVATSKAVTEPLRHDGQVNSGVFSADGKLVITASGDGIARLWEAATGKPVGEPLRHNGGVSSARFSPDGRQVVTASWDSTARVWEVATGKAVGHPLRHDGAVNSAAFSPDGKWVVSASADRTARIWEAATGNPVGRPLQHEGYVWDAAFSPDGKWVVTASADGTARLWEAATGKSVGQALRHDGVIKSAAFSPDGKWVVTASADHTARVWEAATGEAVGEPLRHDDVVNTASFSPDGKWVVTASADHTARFWEAATGKPVGEPLQHNSDVWYAAFGPDGKWVVTASNDYTARMWEAPLEEPISEQLIDVVRLLPAWIGHLDFDANGVLKPVSNSRVTECRDQILFELKQPWMRGSFLAARIKWLLADQRTRSINPTSDWTVPSFIHSTISWRGRASGHARDLVTLPRKTALEEAYELDPAFPLIHLALASVEADPERASFLRDLDLNRLPESCNYATGLDPAEMTLGAAEMCGEQKDWHRALVALDKYAKVGKANARSEALRALAEKSILGTR
jgi:WD40 repeat protein/serine/threonine protein kinase